MKMIFKLSQIFENLDFTEALAYVPSTLRLFIKYYRSAFKFLDSVSTYALCFYIYFCHTFFFRLFNVFQNVFSLRHS